MYNSEGENSTSSPALRAGVGHRRANNTINTVRQRLTGILWLKGREGNEDGIRVRRNQKDWY